MLWKMLGTVQLIVHLPLLAVAFPANASLTFSLIIDLANLKVIPTDWLIEQITGQIVLPKNFGYESGLF